MSALSPIVKQLLTDIRELIDNIEELPAEHQTPAMRRLRTNLLNAVSRYQAETTRQDRGTA